MNRVLVLGAGLVAEPSISYLLDVAKFEVTVASRTVEKAADLIKGRKKGHPVAFDIAKEDWIADDLVSEHDLTISLLPYIHHPKVARSCLASGKPLVTTSYVSQSMREMDKEARDSGVLLLNEIGLDPGIDHMEAMSVIDTVKREGGAVDEFVSYCGGLPSPECNDNPWGYKFSWSPKGVVMASRNDARFRRDGKTIEIPGKDLFANYETVHIEGLGAFEGYPNRDSVPYADMYGIPKARTILRGTLRNRGWCDTWKALHDIGMLEDKGTRAPTYNALMNELAPGVDDIRERVRMRIRTGDSRRTISNWEWLGLFSDGAIEEGNSRVDALSLLLERKLVYRPGERDMIVLQHTFGTDGPEGRRTIRSTLIDYGIPGGPSAMSRTVGLPAAIASEMILKGKFKELSGVMIPTVPLIYEPVLNRLADLGISFLRS